MTGIAWLMLAVGIAMASTASAEAPCTYNTAPAKGLTATMVRAYAACPSTPLSSPNTETEGGIAACTPASPSPTGYVGSSFRFGEKGKCSIRLSAKLVPDCSQLEDSRGNNLSLESGACHVTFVKSRCSGLVHADGFTPVDGTLFPYDDGWELVILVRATLDDDTNGEMTVVDFPVILQYSKPIQGKMSVEGSSAEALIPLFGVTNADLPPCTSIELVSVSLKDADGLLFATMGSATVGQ